MTQEEKNKAFFLQSLIGEQNRSTDQVHLEAMQVPYKKLV